MIIFGVILFVAVVIAIIAIFTERPKKATYNYTFTSTTPPDVTQRVRYVTPPTTVVYNTPPVIVNEVYDPYQTFAAAMIAEEIVQRPVIVEQPVVVEEVSNYYNDSSNDATGYSDSGSSDSYSSSDSSSGGDFGGGGSGGDW
jgi:uncharacterized membrane protein YgcG